MKKPITITVFLAVLGLFILQCSNIDENEKISIPKYHSESNEGIWIDKASSHVPIVTFSGKDHVSVVVPMKPSKRPLHYIEAIVLMDGDREIDSKKFSFTFDEPQANFILPDVKKGNYRVVVKCNIHDMWMAPVIIPGRDKKK
ncbi:MAG TPA: desulfoferrodoxin family protein [Spirochaetota bacterium]|nr:desulfoferrodoxin family protein [Spirochaetota bacterium]HPV43405.1 desulfoferrodoxin family protein [Spirochaetota bacterium]